MPTPVPTPKRPHPPPPRLLPPRPLRWVGGKCLPPSLRLRVIDHRRSDPSAHRPSESAHSEPTRHPTPYDPHGPRDPPGPRDPYDPHGPHPPPRTRQREHPRRAAPPGRPSTARCSSPALSATVPRRCAPAARARTRARGVRPWPSGTRDRSSGDCARARSAPCRGRTRATPGRRGPGSSRHCTAGDDVPDCWNTSYSRERAG